MKVKQENINKNLNILQIKGKKMLILTKKYLNLEKNKLEKNVMIKNCCKKIDEKEKNINICKKIEKNMKNIE